jgi:hypothetical protein
MSLATRVAMIAFCFGRAVVAGRPEVVSHRERRCDLTQVEDQSGLDLTLLELPDRLVHLLE